ncbi:MAG TPA: nitronate monooxygenase [Herpetosiphonaceae bacterium]
MAERLPPLIAAQTVLPAIAAPMFLVSGPELVAAACLAGVIGAFPTPNARTSEILDDWMGRIAGGLAEARGADPARKVAPWAANLVVHRSNSRLQADLDLVVKHRAPIVITALGSPAAVIEAVHGYGGLVLADVNSVPFAAKAAKSGADGLVLVAAGAGGHTGQLTGFAFVDAVRRFWDGIIVLGGGIASGRAIRAAQVLGADLAYLGTSFIATDESLAPPDYKAMVTAATADDLVLTAAFTGVPANMLRPSLLRAGLDPAALAAGGPVNFDQSQAGNKLWKDIWAAGQGLGMIDRVQPAAALIAQLRREYEAALAAERENAWG